MNNAKNNKIGSVTEYSDTYFIQLKIIMKNHYPSIGKMLIAMTGAFIYLSIVVVLCFKWINPPTSSFMLQRKLQAWWNNENNFTLHYEWAAWKQISPYTKIAAITSEDQNFANHWGFDMGAIEKAIKEHEDGERLRGASTISQQTAKNLFLWSGKSFIRKGIEAYFTILIEGFWSKKRILEIYLNIVEFGNGVYGVKAAASQYFHISPDKLSMMQSALLVTALPNPRDYDLSHPSNYMIRRRNWNLQYMMYLGNKAYLRRLE